ncbi:hypothetical protein ABK040_012799 [Willaertia magna]
MANTLTIRRTVDFFTSLFLLTEFVGEENFVFCVGTNINSAINGGGDTFFSQVDRISCNCLGDGEILDNYHIVFTTLYAQSLSDKCIERLKYLIKNRRIAIVFLRGDNNNIPYQLGYVKSQFVEWVYGSTFSLNYDKFKEISNTSYNLSSFSKKHEHIINTFRSNEVNDNNTNSNIFKKCLTMIKNKLKNNNALQSKTYNLDDEFICGIRHENIVNINDWHEIAFSFNTATYETNDETQLEKALSYCILVHKQYKVLFSHWYGYSHGNAFSHELLSSLLKYLLFEHSNEKGRKIFIQKLWNECVEGKLVDIDFY